MRAGRDWTRREFVSGAAAVGAVGAVPGKSFPMGLLDGAQSATGAGASEAGWQEQGVLHLDKSPYAKLRNVPVRAVTIKEGFWSRRRVTNVQASIPSMHAELLEHGRMDNFLRLKGKSSAPQQGPLYSDSDIYKWVEAVGFALQSEDHAELRGTTDGMIREVVAVQEPSGYLNTYFQGDRVKERMTTATQKYGHEMYCLGHMLQGGTAYYRATGDRTLLEAGVRYVDEYVLPQFGPAPKRPIVSGHPEIEMALIELYRTTSERKYLELAGYILQGDARAELRPGEIVYTYCGIPFTSRTKLEGHAVRAMYACCGATDYYLETGEAAYLKTLEVLWHDLSRAQMYITGGVGARSQGEAFGDDYELPNARAYGESCAAIGNMMWNWRMLAATGEARFTDVLERALYNGINSGMSLDGKTYCYRNPLAFDPSTGDVIRNAWYDTTCCPPNIERTLASLPGYFYSTSKDGVYVHLYDNSEMRWKLESGTGLRVTQETNYPWEGAVRLTIAPEKAEEFTVHVRIPGWSRKTEVKVNGAAAKGAEAGQYLAIRRRWAGATVVELSFDMEPQMMRANPAVADDTGRVALERGPLVYCMESIDQQRGTDSKSFPRYTAKTVSATKRVERKDVLDGIVMLEQAGAIRAGAGDALYAEAGPAESGPGGKTEVAALKLIPYYAWANREACAMQVWIPEMDA